MRTGHRLQILFLFFASSYLLPRIGIAQDSGGAFPADPVFERHIPKPFNHVYRIGNFYILGTGQKPKITGDTHRTGKEVVLQAIKLFSSLLDTDADGKVDQPELLKTMGDRFAFAIGSAKTLRPLEEQIYRTTGRYVISMKTDIWPYFPNWKGTGFKLERLDSSLWRPERMNALWEECFHVYTEAWNRHSKTWNFDRQGFLGKSMAADIKAGTYDIQKQNQLEGGDYDWNTAVNEYIHQIWLIQIGHQTRVLTPPQNRVLAFLRSHEKFPQRMDKDYAKNLAVKIR
jgi:hypothetical protein